MLGVTEGTVVDTSDVISGDIPEGFSLSVVDFWKWYFFISSIKVWAWSSKTLPLFFSRDKKAPPSVLIPLKSVV